MSSPARVPNLLVNGSSGLRWVWRQTPHNLREAQKRPAASSTNPAYPRRASDADHAWPGFPDRRSWAPKGSVSTLPGAEGKGQVIAEIEEEGRTPQIIITEIPFQVNKARLIEHIANLVRDKKGREDQRYPRRVGPTACDRDRPEEGVAPPGGLDYLYCTRRWSPPRDHQPRYRRPPAPHLNLKELSMSL